MKIIKYLLLINLLILINCSEVDRNITLKLKENDIGWLKENNIKFIQHFRLNEPDTKWSSRNYYFCDSLSSVAIFFSNMYDDKYIYAFGPPLIPIVYQSFFYKNPTSRVIKIKINIASVDSIELDSLVNHIHFFINDSLKIVPLDTQNAISARPLKESSKNLKCIRFTKYLHYYSTTFKFRINSRKFKKILIIFDNEFNQILKTRYRNLNLKKKNKYYYFPCLPIPFYI